MSKAWDQFQVFGNLAEVLLELVIVEVVVGDGGKTFGDGVVDDVVVGIVENPFVDFGLQCGSGRVGDGHISALEVEEVVGQTRDDGMLSPNGHRIHIESIVFSSQCL